MNEPVDSSTTEAERTDIVPAEVELADELLVEEISIDGMCGVY
jgi:mycofactocin precursor